MENIFTVKSVALLSRRRIYMENQYMRKLLERLRKEFPQTPEEEDFFHYVKRTGKEEVDVMPLKRTEENKFKKKLEKSS